MLDVKPSSKLRLPLKKEIKKEIEVKKEIALDCGKYVIQ